MAAIIRNVQANEEHYRNIEVIQRIRYRLAKDAQPRTATHILEYEGQQRCVLQNRLIYLKETSKEHLESGADQQADSLQGYDGEVTRRVEKRTSSTLEEKISPLVNLYHERFEDTRLFTPHRWLLSGSSLRAPLSVYLRAGKGLASHPNAGPYGTLWDIRCSFESDEVVDGMPCVKIRGETLDRNPKGTLNTLRFLWLATERNYLPVKTEAYDAAVTLKVPVSSARASDFREIRAAVGLPFYKVIKGFDRYIPEFATKGLMVERTSSEAWIVKAGLDPNYDINLFRDIPFPDGAVVYEVKNGEPDKGRVHHDDSGLIGWFLLCNVPVLMVIAWIAWRKVSRYRRLRGLPEKGNGLTV